MISKIRTYKDNLFYLERFSDNNKVNLGRHNKITLTAAIWVMLVLKFLFLMSIFSSHRGLWITWIFKIFDLHPVLLAVKIRIKKHKLIEAALHYRWLLQPYLGILINNTAKDGIRLHIENSLFYHISS